VVQEVHNDTCDNCHNGGTYTAATNGLGSATNGVDGDAGLAEGAANADPKFNPAVYTCTLCHPADGNSGAFNTKIEAHHIASPNNYAANGQCTQCHADSGSYAGDHTGTVSLATNCADCHTGTAGNSGPTFNIPTASGDNKVHDACTTCHQTAGGLTGPYGVAQVMDDNATFGGTDGGGSCESCHTSGFDGYHLISIDHDALVDEYVNCTSCHTDTDAVTGVNGGAVPLDGGDNKKHDTCSTCHQADGRLSGSAVGNDGGTSGGSDGGGTCFTCHDEYFDSHTSIDHSTSVALDTATASKTDCIDCHTGTEGDTSTVPLDPTTPAGDKKHDTCSTCHDSTGALTGSAAGNDNSTPNGTDGGGDCTVCHGSYFDSHAHHGTNNQVTFSSTIDRSQELDDPSTTCDQCHTPSGGISTWTGVYNEHSATCNTCHNFTADATGDPGTPVVATVDTIIGTDATANCTTCHVPKLWSSGASSTHGGHVDTHFGWGADECQNCHGAGAGAEPVVSNIHSGNCDLCHSSSPYSAANNGIGTVAATTDGKDGDAALAEGSAGAGTPFDPAVYTCSTCHPADGNAGAFNTIPEAHHIASPNNYAATGNCTQCHADSSSYAGDHTATVSLATNCADCHTGTEGNSGPTFNISTASGDNKVHDACTTCHQTVGGLTGAGGFAQVMNDGGTFGGTDGGGSCEDCHTSGFTGYHTGSVNHTTMVDTYANCSSCHTESGSTVAPGDPKTHDACSTCHLADGRLTGSAAGNNGAGHGGSDGGGTCFTCHGEYFPSHGTIDHSTSVALDTATASDIDCIDCHTGTEGDTSTVPLDASTPAGDKKHDTCTTCHDSTGALTGSAAGNDNSTPNGTDGGGDCTVCHGSYFDSHTHHSVNNQVSFSSTTDRSQELNNDSTACYQCHDDAGLGKGTSALSTWDSVRLEHDVWDGSKDATGGCTTCHDYTTVGEKSGPDTPLLSTVQSVIGTDATANCTTCHVPKLWTQATSTHGGHSASNFGWAGGCEECHGAGAGAEVVVADIHGNNCDLCHTGGTYNATTNGIGTVANTTNGKDGDAILAEGAATAGIPFDPSVYTCQTCHPADGNSGAFNTKVQAHHDLSANSYANNGLCDSCHIDPRVARSYPVIKQKSCRACHIQLNGSTVEVLAITLGTEAGTGTGLDAGNTTQVINTTNGFTTNHVFPNSNAGGVDTAIENYGACYECHGDTGRPGYDGGGPGASGDRGLAGAAPYPHPYHALPKPGAYSTTENTIGGDGWQGGLAGTPDVTRFRGNQNWDPQSNNSYWPYGKGRMNIGYGQHSLAKGSTNTVYKVTNNTAGTVYQNFVAGLRFGMQRVRAGMGGTDIPHYVPHFDTAYVPPDTVSITAGPTAISGQGNTFGWELTATSTTSANLHVIWGGVDVGTISSGGTFQIYYRDTKNDPLDQHICIDQYNSYAESPVAVVSEDGGYATGTGVALRGVSTSTVETVGCSYIYDPY
jgi:hypothetical protein